MVFRHGKDSALIAGPYDITQWITSATVPSTFELAETSHWGTQSKTYIPGLNAATATVDGLFDTDPTKIDAYMTAITNDTTGMPITVCTDGGCKVGRRASIGRAKRTTYDLSTAIGDVVKFSGAFQFTGAADQGWILADNASYSVTQTFATVDGVAASTAGVTAFAHVIANTGGSNTIKIQHSSDGSTWVDLSAATTISTTPNYYVLSTTGTVNRYLRAVLTITSGAATVPVSAFRN